MQSYRVRSGGRRVGSVTPLAILSLALLIAVVAVVVDGGTLIEDRRHVQATADAAALAAAADLFANYNTNQGTDPDGTAQASALTTAAANGYSNDGEQSIVTVNISPANYQSGPNAGTPLPPGYAEVIVQHNAARTFSNIFGTGTIPVRARAVARGLWVPDYNNMAALNDSAAGAVQVNGNVNVNINGGLLVNSNSSSAVTVGITAALAASPPPPPPSPPSPGPGPNGSEPPGLVKKVLSPLLNPGLPGPPPGTPPPLPPVPVSHGSSPNPGPPMADPLRYLPPPSTGQLSVQSSTSLNINSGTQTLSPGIYQGGISISENASVTLTPGIYIIQGGGLKMSGSSSLMMVEGDTSGVMIYNDWKDPVNDSVNLASGGSVVLAPLSSGAYQGLTIFQKHGASKTSVPALTIAGSGGANITGTIYAAFSTVTLECVSGNNLLGGQIIADTVQASGSGTININPGEQPTACKRIFGLVE